MKKFIIATILALAVLNTSLTAQAADKPAPDKKEKKANHIPFKGKVSAVDKAAKTVTLEGKEKSRTFQVTSETKIHKGEKPATLDDVTVGEVVTGAYKDNEGKLETLTLNIGKPAKDEKKPKDEKKAK